MPSPSTLLFWKREMCPLMSNQVIFILFIITHFSIYLGAESLDNIHNEEIKENRIKGTVSNMTGKIIGGEYASIHEYPHAVNLMAFCDEEFVGEFWACGSSVLTQNILLSAGHCVHGCKLDYEVIAYAGSSNFYEAKTITQVSRYILHSEFDIVRVFADISILFLNGSLPLGQDIKRVIVSPTFPRVETAKMAGWGAIEELMRTPTSELKVVSQNLLTSAFCAKYERMQLGTICATSGSKHDYPFTGDSGSALITQDKQAIGLVSYRIVTRPELIIYTNVSHYYFWIQRYSKSLYCNN